MEGQIGVNDGATPLDAQPKAAAEPGASGQIRVSFEFFPPKTTDMSAQLWQAITALGALKPQKRPATAWELLPIAYDDTPEQIWPLAERSCLAHLIKLAEDGRARRDGDRFSA